jgi:molecular chaperone IbpA
MNMRNFDLAPLYRATVGFDRIADLMDRALTADVAQPAYPPYNIEKTAENAYRISIAVAGFAADELSSRGQGRCAARLGPQVR